MITSTPDEVRKIGELRQKMIKIVQPLEEEPNLHTDDETLLRFLRSRDLHLHQAEKLFLASLEWRRQIHPLSVACEACSTHAGSHSLRMVGFDLMYRPVIYSSFTQASSVNVTAQDVNQHMIFTMENAVRAMIHGVSQWILVLDCTGMSLASCNPKLGFECTQVLSNHYPERLAHALCLRPSNTFKIALSAMKKFMPPVTAKKVHLVKFNNEVDFRHNLQKYFNKDLTEWMVQEVKLNGKKVITDAQKCFWQYNAEAKHDPRGCDEYIKEYIEEQHPSGHRPHPNILQTMNGVKLHWIRSKADEAASKSADDEEADCIEIDDDPTEEANFMAKLPSEMRLPTPNAKNKSKQT